MIANMNRNTKMAPSSSPSVAPGSSDDPPLVLQNMTAISRQVAGPNIQDSQPETANTKGWGWGKWLAGAGSKNHSKPQTALQAQLMLQQSQVEQGKPEASDTTTPKKVPHHAGSSPSSTASSSQPHLSSSKQPQHPPSPRPQSPSNISSNKSPPSQSGKKAKKGKSAKKQSKLSAITSTSNSIFAPVSPKAPGPASPTSPTNAKAATTSSTNPLNNLFRRGGLLVLNNTPHDDGGSKPAGSEIDNQALKERDLNEVEQQDHRTRVQTETAWYEQDLRHKQRRGEYLSDDDHYALGLYDRQRYGEDLSGEELSELQILADAYKQAQKDEAELEVLLEQREAGGTIDHDRLYHLELLMRRRMGGVLTEEEDDALYFLEQRRLDQIDFELLLQQKDEGMEVDEGRLYELELLDRKHRGDLDSMTDDELRDVQLLERRREDARLDHKDFHRLLQLQRRGETEAGGDQLVIDDERFYLLSLVDRRRRGENLTEEEDQDLDDYYALRDEEHLDSIELSILLDKRDKGEPNVDEERIYELELLERTRRGPDLTEEEEQDLIAFQERREREHAEIEELKELLERKENGEEVDEERLYQLELLDGKRRVIEPKVDGTQNEEEDVVDAEKPDSLMQRQERGETLDDEKLYESELLGRKLQNGDSRNDKQPIDLADQSKRREDEEAEDEELLTLLAKKDRGEAIDEQRLYFLELVMRKRRGRQLTHEENETLIEIEEEMEGRLDEEELHELLQRKENGEEVDENRLYELELIHRKRLGEDLTDDELMDLELFELQRTEGQNTVESVGNVDDNAEEESIGTYENMCLTPSERDALDKVQIELKAQGLPISITFSPGSKQRDKLQMSSVSHGDESYIQDLINQRENRADERQEETLEEALELYHIALREKKLPESEQLFLAIFDKILKEKNDEAREKDRQFDDLLERELKLHKERKQERVDNEDYEKETETLRGEQAIETKDVHGRGEPTEAQTHRANGGQPDCESSYGERLEGEEEAGSESEPERFVAYNNSFSQEKSHKAEENIRCDEDETIVQSDLVPEVEEAQLKATKEHSPEGANCQQNEPKEEDTLAENEGLEGRQSQCVGREDQANVNEELVIATDVGGEDGCTRIEDQPTLQSQQERISAEHTACSEAESIQTQDDGLIGDHNPLVSERQASSDGENIHVDEVPSLEEEHLTLEPAPMHRDAAFVKIELIPVEEEYILDSSTPMQLPTQVLADEGTDIVSNIGGVGNASGGTIKTARIESAPAQVETAKTKAWQSANLKMQHNANAKLEKQVRRQLVQTSLVNAHVDEVLGEPVFAPLSIQDDEVPLQNDGIVSLDESVRRMHALNEETGQFGELHEFALTNGEFDELNNLLDAQERGEVIDDDRLYELELLDRYSLAEPLTLDETKHLEVIMKRRKRFQIYTEEYNLLLDRKESGEDVDEDRLYCLELLVRKRLGESLSATEMEDLDEFEAVEGGKEVAGIYDSGSLSRVEIEQAGDFMDGDIFMMGISDEPLALLPEVEEEELSPSECSSGESGSATTDEMQSDSDINEELNGLLERREQGEDIDEQRLYELELLFRHANGEDLSNEEIEDLKFFRERKVRLERYTKEYNELLDRKEIGDTIDENRLYCLELVVRNRLGESLTDEEFDVLEMFESEEEKAAESSFAQEQERSFRGFFTNDEGALADSGKEQSNSKQAWEDHTDGLENDVDASGDNRETTEEIKQNVHWSSEASATKNESLHDAEPSARESFLMNDTILPHREATGHTNSVPDIDRLKESITADLTSTDGIDQIKPFDDRSVSSASSSKGTNAFGMRHDNIDDRFADEMTTTKFPENVPKEMDLFDDGFELATTTDEETREEVTEYDFDVGVTGETERSDMVNQSSSNAHRDGSATTVPALNEREEQLGYKSNETTSNRTFESIERTRNNLEDGVDDGFMDVNRAEFLSKEESEENEYAFCSNENVGGFSSSDWNGFDEKKDSFIPQTSWGDEGPSFMEEDRYPEGDPGRWTEGIGCPLAPAKGTGESSMAQDSEIVCNCPPIGMTMEDTAQVTREGLIESRPEELPSKHEIIASSNGSADYAQSTRKVKCFGENLSGSSGGEAYGSMITDGKTDDHLTLHASEDVTLKTEATSESGIHLWEQASSDYEQQDNCEGLTTSEREELIDLLDNNENGNEVDEERLYELELLDRYSKGEDLAIDELEDLEFIKERRRRLKQYQNEYEAIVAKKRTGEKVDDFRFYSLGLLEKRRLGDPLTDQELKDLEDFELEEDEERSEVQSGADNHSSQVFLESCSLSLSLVDVVGDARKQALEFLASDGLDDAVDVAHSPISPSPLHLSPGVPGRVQSVSYADMKNVAIDREKDELNDLLDRFDNGELVDEQRLYELDLLERDRQGEQMSDQEQQDLVLFREKREQDIAWEVEYQRLLERQRCGENVDEERFYFLELLDKRRHNEELSGLERDDLQLLLLQEEEWNETSGDRESVLERLDDNDTTDGAQLIKVEVIIERESNEYLSQSRNAPGNDDNSQDYHPIVGKEDPSFQASSTDVIGATGGEKAGIVEAEQMSSNAAEGNKVTTINTSKPDRLLTGAANVESSTTELEKPLGGKSLPSNRDEGEDSPLEDKAGNAVKPIFGWGIRLFGLNTKKKEIADKRPEPDSINSTANAMSLSDITAKDANGTKTSEIILPGRNQSSDPPVTSHQPGPSDPIEIVSSGVEDIHVATSDSMSSGWVLSQNDSNTETLSAPTQGPAQGLQLFDLKKGDVDAKAGISDAILSEQSYGDSSKESMHEEGVIMPRKPSKGPEDAVNDSQNDKCEELENDTERKRSASRMGLECDEDLKNTLSSDTYVASDERVDPVSIERGNQLDALFGAAQPASSVSDAIMGDEGNKRYGDELYKREQNGEELTDDELFELEMFLKQRDGVTLTDDELDELLYIREKRHDAAPYKDLEECRNKSSLLEAVDKERVYESEILAPCIEGKPLTDDEVFELDAFDRIRSGKEPNPKELEDLNTLRDERSRRRHYDQGKTTLQTNTEETEIDEYHLLEIELRRKQDLTDYELYALELLDQLRAGGELNENELNDLDHMRAIWGGRSSPQLDSTTQMQHIPGDDVEYAKELRHRMQLGEMLDSDELYEFGLINRLEKGESLHDDELSELRRMRQKRKFRATASSELEYLRNMRDNGLVHDEDLLYELELFEKCARHEDLDGDEQIEIEIFEKRREGKELSREELDELQILKKRRIERVLDDEDLRDLRERKHNGEEVDEDLLYELELFDVMRKGMQLTDNQMFEVEMFQLIREGEVLSDDQIADLEHLKRERLEAAMDEEEIRDLRERMLRGETIDEDLLYELELFQRHRNGETLSNEELFELDLFERLRNGEDVAEDDLDELELLKSNRMRQAQSTCDQNLEGAEQEDEEDEDSVYRRDLLERQMKGQRLDKQEFHWLEILQKQKRTKELLEDELDELEIMRRQRKEKHVVVQNTKKLLEKEMNRKMKRELKEQARKEKSERREQRRKEKAEKPKIKKMRRKIKKKDSDLSIDVMTDVKTAAPAPTNDAPVGTGVKISPDVEITGMPTMIPATEKKETSKNGIFGGVFGRKTKSKKEMELEELKRRQEELIKEQMKAMSLENELKELEREREVQEQLVQETIDKKNGTADKDSVSSWETDTAYESAKSDDDDSSSMSSSSSSESDSSDNLFEVFGAVEGGDGSNFTAEATDLVGSLIVVENDADDAPVSFPNPINPIEFLPNKRQTASRDSSDMNKMKPLGDQQDLEDSLPPSQNQPFKSVDFDEMSGNSGTPNGDADNGQAIRKDTRDKNEKQTRVTQSPKYKTKALTISAHLKKQQKKKRTSKKNKTKYGDDLSIGTMQWAKLQKESRTDEEAESRRAHFDAEGAGTNRRQERPWMPADGENVMNMQRFPVRNSSFQVQQPVPGEVEKFFGKDNQHVFDRSVFNFHQSFGSKLGIDDDASKGSASQADSLTSAELTREGDIDTNVSCQSDDLDAHQSLLESLASSIGTLEEEAYLFAAPDYDNIESRLAEKLRNKEAEFDAAWANIVADQNVAAQINQRLRERQRVKGSGKEEKKEDGNDIHDVPRLFLFEGEKSTKKKKKRTKKKDRRLQRKLDRTLSKEFRKAMKEVFNSDSEEEYDKTFGNEGASNDSEMKPDSSRRGHLRKVKSNDRNLFSEDGSEKSYNDGANGSEASDESDGFDGGYLQRLQERSMQQEVKQMMFESRRQLMTKSSMHSESSDDDEMSQASGNSGIHHESWQRTDSTRYAKDGWQHRKSRKPKRNRTGELVGDDIDPADVYTKEVEKQKEKKILSIAELRKEMEDLKQTKSFMGSATFNQPTKPAIAPRKQRLPKAPKKPASNVSLDGPSGLQSERPGLGARTTSFATAASDQGLLTGAPKSFGGGLGAHPETIEEEEEEEEAFLTGGNQIGDFGGFNDSPGNSKSSGMGFNARFSTFSFFSATGGDASKSPYGSKTPSKSKRLPSLARGFGSNVSGGFLSPTKTSRTGGGDLSGSGLGDMSSSMAPPPPLIPPVSFQEPLPLPEMEEDDRTKSRPGSMMKFVGMSKKMFSSIKFPGKKGSTSHMGGGFMMDDDDDRDEGGMGLLG